MTRVLITDSDSRSALAATRSLGRRGYQVINAGVSRPSLAGASRFSSEFVRYPDPASDSAGFVREILGIAASRRIDVLLPMTEITTLLVTQHRDELPAACRLPFPASDVVARASDKAAIMELAREVRVPIPATLVLSAPGEAAAVADQVPYPAVIKPARSRVPAGSSWISTGVGYAQDPAEFLERIASLDAAVFPVLVQERIAGAGVGIFACYEHGKPIALFSHRRLREKPPSGGVSVLRESATLDPLAAEHAKRLLTQLGWHGVAMVEFKQDSRDGSLRLMEINGRFWGSLQLAIDAGVDFPGLLVDLALNRAVAPVKDYRIGVRSRWLWGDVDVLLAVLLQSRRRLNLPASHAGRWRALWEFAHLWGHGLHYEVEQWDDPAPGLLEARRWFFGR